MRNQSILSHIHADRHPVYSSLPHPTRAHSISAIMRIWTLRNFNGAMRVISCLPCLMLVKDRCHC
jgi:hypothetical protein